MRVDHGVEHAVADSGRPTSRSFISPRRSRRSSRSSSRRVELRCGLREVVVGLGQLASLHVLHQHREVGDLAAGAPHPRPAQLVVDLQDLAGLRLPSSSVSSVGPNSPEPTKYR